MGGVEEEEEGGGYCPGTYSLPASIGTYCIPVPPGRPAPIRWWSYKPSYSYATCTKTMIDNDVGAIGAGNTIVLPHEAEYLGDASNTCFTCPGGAWGLSPVFYDRVTGKKFHFNHLKPGWNTLDPRTDVGKTFKAGSFVGVSGGDTCETGYRCTGSHGAGSYPCNGSYTCQKEDGTWANATQQNSTGAHFCVVSPDAMAIDFPPTDPLPATCNLPPSVGPYMYNNTVTTRTVTVAYSDPEWAGPALDRINYQYVDVLGTWRTGTGTFSLTAGSPGKGTYRWSAAINGTQFKFWTEWSDPAGNYVRYPTSGLVQ